MNIGNIVTKSKILLENFNVYNDLSLVDNDLPTIIIGWKTTKEIMGEGVSILHKKINNNLFWTFDKTERKSEFEIDLDLFKEHCFNNFGSNIPYVFLDLLHNGKKINYKIIRKILTLKTPITYFTENDMVYIYGENIIFGIDLNVIDFFKDKKLKIIDKIRKIKDNTLVDEKIFNKCKDLINKKRYVPYVYGNGIER